MWVGTVWSMRDNVIRIFNCADADHSACVLKLLESALYARCIDAGKLYLHMVGNDDRASHIRAYVSMTEHDRAQIRRACEDQIDSARCAMSQLQSWCRDFGGHAFCEAAEPIHGNSAWRNKKKKVVTGEVAAAAE